MNEPQIIQGGMGAGVSGWRLARAVASRGQLGVVSGTALDTILVRRLQDGDPGGHARRAMTAFPVPEIAKRATDKYFLPDGRRPGDGYRLLPLLSARLTPEREDLLVLANFVEVYLAREGHTGVVGINLLEKIQLPTLPSLYGAMLAGVHYVLIGAGIPVAIPEVLDRLSSHLDVAIPLDLRDRRPGSGTDDPVMLRFNPRRLGMQKCGLLHRPRFIPIISSATLARALIKKAKGTIEGFVVEGPLAGGHNAPPRGEFRLSDRGEPIYGERDVIDLEMMRTIGLPFWLAGSHASAEKLRHARASGAQGVQVGTAFAFCEESGLDPDLKRRFLRSVLSGDAAIFTDPSASPTGFPFKVAQLDGTISEVGVYRERSRMCDLGYLRQAYEKPDGTIGFRCAAEVVDDYTRKGGTIEDTVNRKCLCNGLMANIGLGQIQQSGYRELPLVTAGDDIECLKQFITADRLSYTARDVLAALLGGDGLQGAQTSGDGANVPVSTQGTTSRGPVEGPENEPAVIA